MRERLTRITSCCLSQAFHHLFLGSPLYFQAFSSEGSGYTATPRDLGDNGRETRLLGPATLARYPTERLFPVNTLSRSFSRKHVGVAPSVMTRRTPQRLIVPGERLPPRCCCLKTKQKQKNKRRCISRTPERSLSSSLRNSPPAPGAPPLPPCLHRGSDSRSGGGGLAGGNGPQTNVRLHEGSCRFTNCVFRQRRA